MRTGWAMKVGVAAAALGLASAASAGGPVARFDYLAYESREPAQPLPEGTYRNPVIPGFHPDPSIVRVGKDFYAVTSTFSWFPGLPILHSTDLVNWRVIGNAIDRPGQLDFSGLGTNRGLFAPAITHHQGRFWIVNTCIDCGGNFVITADDPAGPWSDPRWLDFGGIDPSLFFDEDGSAWIVYNDAPPGPPRYEGHRALWLQRFDPKAMQVLPERTLLVDGGVDPEERPIWAEGPHIYKVGGWYYLLAAEGGTADQHSQTIYRAPKITGPYVPGPFNPILTQRDLPPNRPDRIEATGHADIVELDDGTWWGLFLATRPFAGQSTLMGRETFLLPLRWKDGWPRFLDRGEPVPLVLGRPRLPQSAPSAWDSWREEFDGPLGPEWIGLRTPGPRALIATDDGALRVAAGSAAAGSLGKPAFIGRRLRHHRAAFVTRFAFAPERRGDFAGLLAFMDEHHFLAAGKEGARLVVRLRKAAGESAQGEIIAQAPLTTPGPIELRLELDGGTARVLWRADASAAWQALGGPIDVEPLASVHAGLFTGLVVGPYAHASG
ncbi:MAG: glycoside hydrolase 43 family protein [Erythrobacter sp.]|nr:MAG: glycoside hydrolase 43 family protein [Erythrobacter sp.]